MQDQRQRGREVTGLMSVWTKLGGEGAGGMNWEKGTHRHTRPRVKQIVGSAG